MKLGSVPYVNALPLIWGLDNDPEIEVEFREPSQLPPLLESGAAQAVLVSSIYSITVPGCRVVRGTGIGSEARTGSVKLFSRKPLSQVKTLALDSASMTSSCLAQIVIQEASGSLPATLAMKANLQAALDTEGLDAALAIGDYGMTAGLEGVTEYDLGELWRELTSLPFVWAMWTGRQDLSDGLADRLRLAAAQGTENLDAIAQTAKERIGQECRAYFTECICYRFDRRHEAGLQEFARRAEAAGLAGGAYPEFV